MNKEDHSGSGASSSSPLNSNNMDNNTGSSLGQQNQELLSSLAIQPGAAMTVDLTTMTSLTDITLDQALTKLKEIDRENILLKEHLAENNTQIKRQFEVLRSLNIKDKEKVNQFKALISSLREEVKDLQIKNMTQEDKEKENEKKLTTLENENAHLQRQKTLSEQRVVNVVKHAELLGVVGLDEVDNLPDISDAVLVSTEDKEKKIENLQASIADKDEALTTLRNELLTMSNQRDQFKMSNEVLLKDMRSLQKHKEEMDTDRRQLHELNMHLNKELDQQMQSNIACTKKEIEVQRQVVEEVKTQALASDFLDDRENLEELFDQKLNLQQHQEEISRLREEVEAEKADKVDLEEKVQLLSKELNELTTQHTLAREKIDLLEKEKIKLSEEFEENLTSITHQRQENEKIQQAKVSEDQSALRSQVVSLLTEVDELNKKLSAATMALQQKDRRIAELTDANTGWRDQFDEHWHQSSSMIQALQSQLSQQETVSRQHIEEHNGTKQRYQALQENFNKLVTDYKELLEMFENVRSKSHPQAPSKEQEEKMNELAAQVVAAEEAINYRDKQLEEWKRKCADKDSRIQVLDIQLETYRTDFESLRESRTNLAQENNALQDQLRNLTEQHNQRQMEEIQRRVSQSGRLPTYNEAHSRFGYQSANSPSSQQQQQQLQQHQLQQQRLNAYQQLHAGMQNPHAMRLNNNNNNNNTYRPQNNQPHPGNVAGRPVAQFDDPEADQFPSFVHQCPTCGEILPDTDSLQLHVSDCLDRQQQM